MNAINNMLVDKISLAEIENVLNLLKEGKYLGRTIVKIQT